MAYDYDQMRAPILSNLRCATRFCWMTWCYKSDKILMLEKEDPCEEVINEYSSTRI